MTNKITFYAILGPGATLDCPLGLIRRLEYDNGWEDEGLRKDMSWKATPLLVEHQHGNAEEDLVEVSHSQASRIVQYLRGKFASDS